MTKHTSLLKSINQFDLLFPNLNLLVSEAALNALNEFETLKRKFLTLKMNSLKFVLSFLTTIQSQNLLQFLLLFPQLYQLKNYLNNLNLSLNLSKNLLP